MRDGIILNTTNLPVTFPRHTHARASTTSGRGANGAERKRCREDHSPPVPPVLAGLGVNGMHGAPKVPPIHQLHQQQALAFPDRRPQELHDVWVVQAPKQRNLLSAVGSESGVSSKRVSNPLR